MFVDEAEIEVFAGKGGNGVVAFRREKYVPRGGPAGGDGGKGGDVVLIATRDCNTLSDFRHKRHIRARNGQHGGPKNMTGRGGDDERIQVPVGTIVRDLETDEILVDLTEDGQTFVVARGGDGGHGNARFQTSTNRAPKKCTPGWPGEEKHLHLELKLIADIALVGYPSVGKSTVIAALSNARPKIAAYPFTTLVPNLGVVKFGDYGEFVIADIPGLIEGAHEGHGLGIQFLKHIERTRLIAHIVEVTPQLEGFEDERDPFLDFERINNELKAFNPDLADRPQLVVLNKIDLPFVQEREAELRAHFEGLGYPFVSISAAASINLDELTNLMGHAVVKGQFVEEKEDWELD